MKPCKYGLAEFISNLNSYDVFELVDGKLEFIRREFADEEEEIFCRECARKIKIE